MNSWVGVGVSPGNVPVYYKGGGFKLSDGRLKMIEVMLRCLVCILGVVAAVLVATDAEVKQIFSVQKKAKFTDMKALLFLVIVNGIAAGYSLVQGLHCLVNMIRGRALFSKPLAWVIFSFDQALAYVALAAVAAAAQTAVFSEKGESQMQWMKLCNLYGKFCVRVGEGLAGAAVVSLGLVALSCLSAFNLFRLYGSKSSSSGYW